MINNEVEVDLDSLVNKIFGEEPKEPCSIQLMLDDTLELDELSDLVTYVTVMGIKKLFSVNNEKIKLSNMTDEHINLVKKYVNSFGFNMILKILNKDEIHLKENDFFQKKKLSDYEYVVTTDDKKYFFSFEHIIKQV